MLKTDTTQSEEQQIYNYKHIEQVVDNAKKDMFDSFQIYYLWREYLRRSKDWQNENRSCYTHPPDLHMPMHNWVPLQWLWYNMSVPFRMTFLARKSVPSNTDRMLRDFG